MAIPARRQEPHRFGQEHPEDHPCDGDGRRRAAAPRRAADRGAAPVRRRDPADDAPGRAGRRRRGRAPAAARRARVRARRRPAARHRRPRARRARSTRRSSAPACASAPSSPKRACRAAGTRPGRRGVSSLTFRGRELSGSYTGFTDRPAYADARAIADDLMTGYVDGQLDRVEILYNAYVSPLTQQVTRETLLPLSAGDDRASERRGRTSRPRSETSGPRALVEYEPDPEEILKRLVPDYVEISIYRALRGVHRRLLRRADDRDAQRLRQRGRNHRRLHAADEPRPPGRDHPGDHGGRRRRRGPD